MKMIMILRIITVSYYLDPRYIFENFLRKSIIRNTRKSIAGKR